jgi:predicted transcriptional regulator
LAGTGKRRFKELQKLILKSLKNKPHTINEISSLSGINWNSTSNQLVLLKGNEYVKEIFSHKRLRIFEITEKGRKTLIKK